MAGFRMIRLAPLLVLLLCHLQGLCTASTNGFLTQSEVETAAENNEGIPTQDRLQLLFPSINFTESQNITALSFVATGNPANETLQIQVWRPGLIENSFVRIAAVGNNSLVQGSGPLYRYVLPIPIPVSPGDVLGIHIPWFPGLFLRFRDVGVGNTSTYYFQAANLPQQFITSTAYSSGSQLIPLVAVQFENSTTSLVEATTTVATSTVQVSSTFQGVVESSSQCGLTSTPEAGMVHHNVVSNCTSGFMDLDLLKRRAVKIPEGDRSNDFLDHEFRLIPDMNFTCSGTITSLLIGAAYKTGRLRIEYPEVQVWKINPEGTLYTRQGSEEIRLAAGDFSPDGVLQYTLTTPMTFQSGDVLGVYQPDQSDSLVTLFYNSDASAPTTLRISSQPTTSISLGSLSSISGQHILISPISDSPCTGNFLSPSDLRQRVLEVNINAVRRRDNQQRLFPDIYFTCNGSITKLIAGVEIKDVTMQSHAEIQIWRRNFFGANTYTKVNSILLCLAAPTINNVIEHSLVSPVEFQEGDILGVYQPQRSETGLIINYQERDGPVNYREGSNSLSTVTLDSPDNQYDYPLVTVEISTETRLYSADKTTTRITSLTTFTSSKIDPTLSQHTIILQTMSSSILPTSTTLQNNTIVLFSVAPVALIILLATIAIILVGIFIWRRRNSKDSHVVQHPVSNRDEQVKLQQNVCYTSTSFNDDNKQHQIDIYDEVNHEQGDPPKQSDDQIQLQQNVCYAATCGHKNHNTKNESNSEYSYTDVDRLQHTSNPVFNKADYVPMDSESYYY